MQLLKLFFWFRRKQTCLHTGDLSGRILKNNTDREVKEAGLERERSWKFLCAAEGCTCNKGVSQPHGEF